MKNVNIFMIFVTLILMAIFAHTGVALVVLAALVEDWVLPLRQNLCAGTGFLWPPVAAGGLL